MSAVELAAVLRDYLAAHYQHRYLPGVIYTHNAGVQLRVLEVGPDGSPEPHLITVAPVTAGTGPAVPNQPYAPVTAALEILDQAANLGDHIQPGNARLDRQIDVLRALVNDAREALRPDGAS
jgi:hypothetical protein